MTQQSSTTSQRKAGKQARIKAMMKQLRPDQNSVVDEQLKMSMKIEEDTKCRIGPLIKISEAGRQRISAANRKRARWAKINAELEEDTK